MALWGVDHNENFSLRFTVNVKMQPALGLKQKQDGVIESVARECRSDTIHDSAS